jgi:Heterokaryon incompatibility protein Het-C
MRLTDQERIADAPRPRGARRGEGPTEASATSSVAHDFAGTVRWPMTPDHAFALQRTAGNRAVAGFLATGRPDAPAESWDEGERPAELPADASTMGPAAATIEVEAEAAEPTGRGPDSGRLDGCTERAAERLGDHIVSQVAGIAGLPSLSGPRSTVGPLPPSLSRAKTASPDVLPTSGRVASSTAAPEFASRPMPSPLMRLPSATPSAAFPRALQRYQAGEMGHGGIEAEALAAAGFSGDMGSGEVGAVYFGNWARDLSQLSHNPAVQEIIQTLAWGEFGHGITLEQLGGYMASEHLDNPAGGTSPESGVPVDPSMGLSTEQQASVAEEATAAYTSMIAARAAASGLPDYIERGKEHAKRKLREAVRDRRTPDGMFAMGNALHAMEDYFSHSNFIEVAFSILISEGTVDPKKRPWSEYVKREARFGYSASTAGGKDRFGREQIVSGTYAAGPNDNVSRLELLQTEMTNGALRRALFLGYFRRFMAGGAEMGSSALAPVGRGAGTLVGGEVGAVAGGLLGAGEGAVAGFRRGSGVLGTIASTAGGLFGGGVSGAISGGSAGAAVGGQLGENAMGSVGSAVGSGLGGLGGAGIMALATAFIGPLFASAIAAARVAASTGELDKLAEQQTDKAQGQASARGLGLTHSALAKDAPDHPLFGASRKLAVEMDKAIGLAMTGAWKDVDTALGPIGGVGGGTGAGAGQNGSQAAGATAASAGGSSGTTNPAVEAAADKVTEKVDEYIVHPRANDWWKPIVAAEAASVAASVGGGGS